MAVAAEKAAFDGRGAEPKAEARSGRTDWRGVFAAVFDGMKAAGIDSHPHNKSAEAYTAGQTCLLIFAINMMVVAIGHWQQLVSLHRFVYEPDAARPHKSETLRFVRMLDFAVNVCWSVTLTFVAGMLYTKRMTPSGGAKAVKLTMACAVVLYMIGAVADYLQCHFQAGGIGQRCHGLFCLQAAVLILFCLVVGHFRPRLLFMCCFTVQGALRLEWSSRSEQRGILRSTVVAVAVTLIILPVIAYFQEMVLALKRLECCGQGTVMTQTSKERDVEMDAQAPWDSSARAPSALERVADFALSQLGGQGGQAREGVHDGVDEEAGGQQACVCVQACIGADAQPQVRAKEDDGRVGCGSTPPDSHNGVSNAAAGMNSGRGGARAPGLAVREAVALPSCLEPQGHQAKGKHTDRKRKRREEQNTLVSKLDRILPEEARRGGFKGAGPRSAGVWGRSFLNVLTDTIEHVRNIGAGSSSTNPKTLGAMQLTYRDLLMTSKSMVCIEVEVQDGKLVISDLGAGARDWFAQAPWDVVAGTPLRDILSPENGLALEELRDSLNKAYSTPSAAAWLAKLTLHVSLCRFESHKYMAEGVDLCAGTRASMQARVVDTVEHVAARLQVASFAPAVPVKNVKGCSQPPVSAAATLSGAPRGTAAPAPRAVLMFNLPDAWSQKPEMGKAQAVREAEAEGGWQHADDREAVEVSLVDIVGAAHEFMGVYKLNWPKCKGARDLERLDGVQAPEGLSSLVKLLSDPMALLDEADRATMQSVVASLPTPPDGSDVCAAHRVCELIELHTGMAASNDADSLAIFYRLKLPTVLGGYESPWKPLYLYDLSSRTGFAGGGDGARLKLLPIRMRGAGHKAGVLGLVLSSQQQDGRRRVLHHLLLNKHGHDESLLLQGVVTLPPRLPLRFSLALSKVAQGDKALLDMATADPISAADIEDAIACSFLHGNGTEGLGMCDDVQWTGIDDMSLLFQDDVALDDVEPASSNEASIAPSVQSCSVSVSSPTETSASDNTSPPSPAQATDGSAAAISCYHKAPPV